MGEGTERTVDLHHRVQLGLVKAVELQLAAGGDPARAAAVVAQLLDFTRVHFAAEELLMRLHRYPQADAHAEAHVRLLAQAASVAEAHRAGDPASTRDTAERLRAWLLEHVEGMDEAFDGWCARSGVSLE
jgi:hemerythrin